MLAIVAHRTHGTNALLAERGDALILPPRTALAMLDAGDLALGRLDVRPSLEGIERGLWSLRRLGERGVRVLNDADSLTATHEPAGRRRLRGHATRAPASRARLRRCVSSGVHNIVTTR